MKIEPIRTEKIIANAAALEDILDRAISSLSEESILVVTSKIVSLCEGRVVPLSDVAKDDLVKREADRYLPRETNKYRVLLTITRQILAPSAGIDESNGDGFYILWPADPQRTANDLRRYLRKRFNLTHVGVLITDSKSSPLRKGTTGVMLAHSGFYALKDYVGEPDLFGRNLHSTKANLADGLAAAAVAVMGEGDEQTPLALLTELPKTVVFSDQDPTGEELAELAIEVEDDIYAPALLAADWIVGGHGREDD